MGQKIGRRPQTQLCGDALVCRFIQPNAQDSSIRSDASAAPEDAAEQGGLAKGLGLLLAGTFCMFRSNWFIVTFPLLTVIYGILTLLGGINKVQWAIDMLRAKQKYWFVAIISAVLTLVFSALILANPFASTAVLWTFIAVTLIVEAVIDIVAFILGRKSFDQAD